MNRRAAKKRIEELGRMEILRHCDRQELSVLADVLGERPFSAGEVLCRTGDKADEVYLVHEGNLLVRTSGGDVVATLASGAIAGELGALGASVRSADLVAASDGSVFVTDAASLRRALSECMGLRKAITPLLAERIDENEQRSSV